MNYEEARQIGPDGPAPGKWNWSNANDSVSPTPFTAHPCSWPDSPIPDGWKFGDPIERTGRERCDHDTREQAEQHFYDSQVAVLQERSMLNQQLRCQYPTDEDTRCGVYTESYLEPPGFGLDRAVLCDDHRTPDGWKAVHPFTGKGPIRLIHS